jgi:carbamoyltransferase
MGLAPYGDPERFAPFFRREVELLDGGSVRIPALHLNRTTDERENYSATRRHLHEALIQERHPDDEITQDHRDVAAALQACLDETMLHIAGSFAKRTGIRKLALAGGVALNCTTNGHLLQSGRFDDIYVQPASGDDGTALGAALYRASRNGEVCNRRMPVPFYGPRHSQAEVDRVLEDFSDRVSVTRFDSVEAVCKRAAEMIADGRVVAWHRGRMEFGPRALGNRSILADPGSPDMRDRINAMVKKRESFRPFAPSVTVEQVGRFFEVPDGKEFPYMIMIVDVRPEFREALPAITHVNGSARVQTVNVKDNPDYHALLKEVGKLTGREMVLNTSFNVKGQPMVNTPREAVETFLGTGIDALFLERCLVTKADPAHE